MYVYKHDDGSDWSWRISRLTNTRFPQPVSGPARALFDARYRYESAARNAMAELRDLAQTRPELFWHEGQRHAYMG